MSYDSVEFPDGKGYKRHGSPAFYKLLEEMADTHDKKSHDYASNDNPSGNYHFAGKLALMFSHSEQDAGFIGRIGEKLYRLANLESGQKIPQNESIEDTERDLCVIMALWMADRRNRRKSLFSSGAISADVRKQFTEGTWPVVKDPSRVIQEQMIEIAKGLDERGLIDMAAYLEALLDHRKRMESAQIKGGSDNSQSLK